MAVAELNLGQFISNVLGLQTKKVSKYVLDFCDNLIYFKSENDLLLCDNLLGYNFKHEELQKENYGKFLKVIPSNAKGVVMKTLTENIFTSIKETPYKHLQIGGGVFPISKTAFTTVKNVIEGYYTLEQLKKDNNIYMVRETFVEFNFRGAVAYINEGSLTAKELETTSDDTLNISRFFKYLEAASKYDKYNIDNKQLIPYHNILIDWYEADSAYKYLKKIDTASSKKAQDIIYNYTLKDLVGYKKNAEW